MGACEYEVFLNFRGKDTRKDFTDTLFHCLNHFGIRTFLDDNEIRHGDQIGPTLFNGIKESKIFVPIFSTNYAESKWCLRELALRVKHNKENIRPFFYDVDPSTVKDQTGPYVVDFKKHENDPNLDIATIEEWRKALKFVGNIKGWEVSQIENGHHGAIATKFASKVFGELNDFSSLDVTENLVGPDDQIQKVMDLLHLGAEDVVIIGICGIGGIGKTTLAKVIYNQILDNFDNHCFLADVREKLKIQGIAGLRKQLISNLFKIKDSDVRDGDKVMKERFRKKKVLIVLDDVDDDSKKIVNLIISPKYFGSGSRIIITTRDKSIIGRSEECRTYDVKELDRSKSIKLFCKYAFKGRKPSADFTNLSADIVATLRGLPLSIEVIGSRLYNELKPFWEETLEMLRSSPEERVPKSLQFSYEQLGDQEKEVFLDIACLFIGHDKDIVTYFWKSRCGLRPTYSITVLTNLSLVKIDEDNRFRMHDLLRELGEDIGKRNSTSLRLRASNEVFSTLESNRMV